MSLDYLLKTEPSEYSFADLQSDAITPGTRLVIYETGDRKCVVGTATVVSVDTSSPKNPAVKIKAGKALAKQITLAQIKADKLFADSPLVRQGRLSVVPLTKEQYAALTGG